MDNLLLAMLIFIAVMVPFAYIGYSLRKKRDESMVNRPVDKQTAICPYCGHVQTVFGAVRNPAFWTCGTCYRIWGDESGMTEEQRKQKKEMDYECYRIRVHLSAQQEIFDAVFKCTGSPGFITFKNGNVILHKTQEVTVIAQYSEDLVKTKVGSQFLARLCLEHCRSQYGDMKQRSFRAWLMDNGGFAWEWIE